MATGCRLLTCLAGRAPELPRERIEQTLRTNVGYAAERVAEAGMQLLLEPVNQYDVPGYPLSPVDDIVALVEAVPAPVGISFDVYHVERGEGRAVERLEGAYDHVRHVQVADVPDRHQPGTGRLDYPRLLATLDRLGYAGAVGLEYIPQPNTATSLDFLAGATAA